MLKITLTSGLIGKRETQKKIIRALGLRKFGSSVTRAECPTIRGMINKVSHLVTVTPADSKD
jgi:large subunit ribosomal protein L30